MIYTELQILLNLPATTTWNRKVYDAGISLCREHVGTGTHGVCIILQPFKSWLNYDPISGGNDTCVCMVANKPRCLPTVQGSWQPVSLTARFIISNWRQLPPMHYMHLLPFTVFTKQWLHNQVFITPFYTVYRWLLSVFIPVKLFWDLIIRCVLRTCCAPKLV